MNRKFIFLIVSKSISSEIVWLDIESVVFINFLFTFDGNKYTEISKKKFEKIWSCIEHFIFSLSEFQNLQSCFFWTQCIMQKLKILLLIQFCLFIQTFA